MKGRVARPERGFRLLQKKDVVTVTTPHDQSPDGRQKATEEDRNFLWLGWHYARVIESF